jgi:hypothetical protein
MSEASQYVFSFKELAEMLVKKENIHEGHWGILLRFGIQGANIALGGGDPFPTAIVPVMEIGIQREPKATPLSGDAAVVNPASPVPQKSLKRPK